MKREREWEERNWKQSGLTGFPLRAAEKNEAVAWGEEERMWDHQSFVFNGRYYSMFIEMTIGMTQFGE